MKTQLKKIDDCKQELVVQVEGDIVKQKFTQVYKRINKEAKIPGFRPGNVPQDILEKRYSAVAQQEILKELLPEVYEQALKETGLEPVNQPKISEVNLNKDSLSFKSVLEVKPKIDLKKYKGLKVEYKLIEVSEEEISQALSKLKQASPARDSVAGDDAQKSDEGYAHSLGYANLETLRKALGNQIYLEKTNTQQINLKNSIIEQLLKQVNFKIPPSLVNQQLESLIKRAELDLTLRGINKEEIQKQQSRLRENLAPQAERQVRTFLVLEEVARQENIARDEGMTEKVIEFLLKQANWKAAA